ncbi:aldehyde dehydrogenase family protein [Roseovarius salis]|uniref:aldehyde dehydrogenase family protein n=1 Tax=Roseovarius salis TaxID=3376063 RepID=UPI0037CAC461
MSQFDPFARQFFHDNAYHPAGEGGTHHVVNPATLEREGAIALGTVDAAEQMLARARIAQKAWGALDELTRASYLHRVADSIAADHADAARLMVLEQGKPYPEATGEIANVAGCFRYFAEMARDTGGMMPGTTQAGSFQFARQFPYGVSVHIVPYNFPILLMCWTVAASLAAGNACVVKPSEKTSLSTLRFMKHFSHLPPGVVSCITGGVETGQALIRSRHSDVVAFTGSVPAAKSVATACAEQLKPCIIEAGGSDPMIVTAEAPLDVAVAGAATAAFHLSGQICTSTERFFVHDAVHDDFVEGLAGMARKLRVGNGLERSEIGPLVNEATRDKVARLVDGAVANGAQLVCGGRVPPGRNTGWFYEPTVLTGVTPAMEIMREEVFGPVAAIVRVGSLDEALEHANDSDFGLGASLFTTSLQEAMEAYDRLEAGMVWVNNPLIDNDALPFGGWKMSGLGRSLSRIGLDSFRQTKMGVIDWKPEIQDWWYPYPDEWFHDTDGSRF